MKQTKEKEEQESSLNIKGWKFNEDSVRGRVRVIFPDHQGTFLGLTPFPDYFWGFPDQTPPTPP